MRWSVIMSRVVSVQVFLKRQSIYESIMTQAL